MRERTANSRAGVQDASRHDYARRAQPGHHFNPPLANAIGRWATPKTAAKQTAWRAFSLMIGVAWTHAPGSSFWGRTSNLASGRPGGLIVQHARG